MKKTFILIILTIFTLNLEAQEKETIEIEINGEIQEAVITEDGDTLIVYKYPPVVIRHKKKFRSSKERRYYYKMEHHVKVVYPYATKAIRIFNELEVVTKDLKKRNRKQHIKRLQNELEKEFKAPLKKLTQTQSRVLIEIIERELDTPMYEIVKDLKGGISASYWTMFSKMYDIDLKQGYNPEDDDILEFILSGMDFSHSVVTND